MLHIILGLFFIALGIWGLYDEFYYVADVFRGGLPIVMVIIGLVATLAGIMPVRPKEEVENG